MRCQEVLPDWYFKIRDRMSLSRKATAESAMESDVTGFSRIGHRLKLTETTIAVALVLYRSSNHCVQLLWNAVRYFRKFKNGNRAHLGTTNQSSDDLTIRVTVITCQPTDDELVTNETADNQAELTKTLPTTLNTVHLLVIKTQW